MSFMYARGYDSAGRYKAMLEEREQRKADEASRISVEMNDAYRLIRSAVDRERLDGYRKHLLLLGRKHKFTIRWHRGSGGSADWGRGGSSYINTPEIDPCGDFVTGEERAAVGYHETAHVIEGVCPDDGVVHRRDRTVTDAWHCIACETAATSRALSLAPFTRPMFNQLARGLDSYRRGTPASPAQIARLDALKGTISYAEHRQRWRKWEDLLARQERANASLALDRARRSA